MSDKCPSCGKTVYPMERVGAVGKSWHKACLKCSTCGKVVRNGQFNDHGGQVYCNGCYESQFVDEETKQIVYDMEATYAKKVHGTAVNVFGGPSATPSKLAKVETNTASAPLSYNNNNNNNYNDDYGGGGPAAPPAPPMKTIPSALSSAIIQSGGKVQKSGGGGNSGGGYSGGNAVNKTNNTAPPTPIQPSRSYNNLPKTPPAAREFTAPNPPPPRRVNGNPPNRSVEEPPKSVPAPPRLVQNNSSANMQKIKPSRSYENLKKVNDISELPPPPSISLPAPPRAGGPPPLVKRKY